MSITLIAGRVTGLGRIESDGPVTVVTREPLPEAVAENIVGSSITEIATNAPHHDSRTIPRVARARRQRGMEYDAHQGKWVDKREHHRVSAQLAWMDRSIQKSVMAVLESGDPDKATGAQLDALAALTGVTR